MTITQILILVCIVGLVGMMLFTIFVMLQNSFGIPPYFPSRAKNYRSLFQKLSQEHSSFADLGSGDGRMVLMASKYFEKSTGVEINLPLVLLSRLFALIKRRHNAEFHWQSYFKTDLNGYDVVFVYLFPNTMQAMEDKLFSELKPGSVIISNTFQFEQHQPFQKHGDVRLYRVE